MPKTALLRKQVVQAGTIESYVGTTPPEGYLLCDGRILNAADYPRLFKVIGTSWGYGYNDGASFHLPDLRGKFLRGVDRNADGTEPDIEEANDPDRADRTPNNSGGNTGNNVGTDQNDKTKAPTDTPFTTNSLRNAHTHSVQVARGNASNGNDRSWEPYQTGQNNESITSFSGGTHSHTITSGGDVETRPVNSSVVFVIKYI